MKLFEGYLKCKRNHSDEEGYNMVCSASLPDSFVENYSFLGCKMESKVSDDQVLKVEQRFKLPNCGVETSKAILSICRFRVKITNCY